MTPVEQLLRSASQGRGGRVKLSGQRKQLHFKVRRTGSKCGITDLKLAKLRALRVAGRSRQPAEHQLNRSMAGQIRGTEELLATDLVLDSGNTIAVDPHELVNIANMMPLVESCPYEVDGKPAISLNWRSGEHFRVEQFTDFNLFAWSCRLSAPASLQLMRSTAEAGGRLIAITATEGSVESEVEFFDRRFVESRADRIRLLRLENSSSTLLWEVSSRPHERGVDFVVMSSDPRPDAVKRWIEMTAMPEVALAEGELIELSRLLEAL